MSTYVDSSVLLTRYLSEKNSSRAGRLLNDSSALVTAGITRVEVRRNLGMIPSAAERGLGRALFERDWLHFHIITVDDSVCELAGHVAEVTRLRTLDALHIAAALSAQCVSVLTFDVRQAEAAIEFGLEVIT